MKRERRRLGEEEEMRKKENASNAMARLPVDTYTGKSAT
jgi:hypothetical protein